MRHVSRTCIDVLWCISDYFTQTVMLKIWQPSSIHGKFWIFFAAQVCLYLYMWQHLIWLEAKIALRSLVYNTLHMYHGIEWYNDMMLELIMHDGIIHYQIIFPINWKENWKLPLLAIIIVGKRIFFGQWFPYFYSHAHTLELWQIPIEFLKDTNFSTWKLKLVGIWLQNVLIVLC